MSNTNATIWSKDNVTIYANGKTYIVGRQYAEFQEITEALKAGDFELALQMADRAEAIRNRSNGEFEVTDNVVYRNGVAVHNVITERILEFVENGLPFAPLTAFLDNVLLNPSLRAVDEGFKFLEHRNMPITEDGFFLAYKAVRADYKDKFSGTIDNSVGQVVSVERNQVDDDFRNECSYGLHVGCLSYSGPTGWYYNEGDKIVIVKVNPKDIVAVPDDHNATKMRVSSYEVIADFAGAFEQPLVNSGGGSFSRPVASDDILDLDEDEATCPECGDSVLFDGELCDDCQTAEDEALTCPDCGEDKERYDDRCESCQEAENNGGCDCELCK